MKPALNSGAIQNMSVQAALRMMKKGFLHTQEEKDNEIANFIRSFCTAATGSLWEDLKLAAEFNGYAPSAYVSQADENRVKVVIDMLDHATLPTSSQNYRDIHALIYPELRRLRRARRKELKSIPWTGTCQPTLPTFTEEPMTQSTPETPVAPITPAAPVTPKQPQNSKILNTITRLEDTFKKEFKEKIKEHQQDMKLLVEHLTVMLDDEFSKEMKKCSGVDDYESTHDLMMEATHQAKAVRERCLQLMIESWPQIPSEMEPFPDQPIRLTSPTDTLHCHLNV